MVTVGLPVEVGGGGVRRPSHVLKTSPVYAPASAGLMGGRRYPTVISVAGGLAFLAVTRGCGVAVRAVLVVPAIIDHACYQTGYMKGLCVAGGLAYLAVPRGCGGAVRAVLMVPASISAACYPTGCSTRLCAAGGLAFLAVTLGCIGTVRAVTRVPANVFASLDC